MNILIPNATSPKNIGDQAMLESLLVLIRKAKPKSRITIHSVDPAMQKKSLSGVSVSHSLLSWLMFEDTRLAARAGRLLILFVQLCFFGTTIDKRLKEILSAYVRADIILFVGNGYVRSNRGVKQSVFLLLNLLPFLIAKNAKKRVIVSPMGFGPFAYRWQTKAAARVLSFVDILYVRESISLRLARQAGLTQARVSADHAFLFSLMRGRHKSDGIGVALRNWLPYKKQRAFEEEIARALIHFATERDQQVQLIVQVHASEHNDKDREVAKRVYELLRKANVSVSVPIVLHSPERRSKYTAVVQ